MKHKMNLIRLTIKRKGGLVKQKKHKKAIYTLDLSRKKSKIQGMTEQTGAHVIHNKLPIVSERPGVYRMLATDGTVLYVGKAKNLKKRLTNYTHTDRLTPRIRQMVSRVADVITIETAGEAEALILESDLIKQFRPYYNILLKDDKSYPYILITQEETPRLVKYRGNRSVKGDYFGPFPSGLAVTQTVKELQKIFGLRTCNEALFRNRTRPCLLYQIGRCAGPCVGCISAAAYRTRVEQARAFLRGERLTLQDDLARQMQDLSARQEYEQAAVIRDKLAALNRIQTTDSEAILTGTDIVALYRRGDTACIQVFFYRSGHAQGNAAHFLNRLNDADTGDILTAFLMQFYDRVPPPRQIILSDIVSGGVAAALSERAGFPVHIIYRRNLRGGRRKLADTAVQNAEQSYHQHIQADTIKRETWEELRQLLQVPTLNKIEVYDNSHLQGTFAVGAMVAATPDGFQKDLYRRFNIDGTRAHTNDDFGMMREVLLRRLSRGITEHDLPDALLIDGGKGQLSAVLDILHDLHLEQIAVLAIAKGEKRNAGLETFFLGTKPDTPIHLDYRGDLIHLLQRLRDEAHRFVITTHRARRAKNMLHESLTDIDEIGAKRKKALLLHFGSAREIAGASVAQLMRVPGINEKIAKKIYTFYHG